MEVGLDLGSREMAARKPRCNCRLLGTLMPRATGVGRSKQLASHQWEVQQVLAHRVQLVNVRCQIQFNFLKGGFVLTRLWQRNPKIALMQIDGVECRVGLIQRSQLGIGTHWQIGPQPLNLLFHGANMRRN